MAQKSKKKPVVEKSTKGKTKTAQVPAEKKIVSLHRILEITTAIIAIITFILTFPMLVKECSTPESAMFYGIVVDETDKPVANAEIQVQEKEGDKTRLGFDKTQANGEFSFQVKAKPEATIWVTVSQDGQIGFQGYKTLLGNTTILFKKTTNKN